MVVGLVPSDYYLSLCDWLPFGPSLIELFSPASSRHRLNCAGCDTLELHEESDSDCSFKLTIFYFNLNLYGYKFLFRFIAVSASLLTAVSFRFLHRRRRPQFSPPIGAYPQPKLVEPVACR